MGNAAKSKKRPKVVVKTQVPELVPDLDEALAALRVDVDLSTEAAALGEADYVILDHRGMDPAALATALKAAGARAIVLTEQEDKENINEVLAAFPVSHVVGLNGKNFLAEIALTLRKLTTGEVFGIDQYFADGIKAEVRRVSSADQIDQTIEELLGRVDMKASFSATREFLTMTANELTTNAVYNAPVDEQNRPKYEQTDRRNKIKLLETEEVEIAVCEDEHTIAISVSDQFGRLDRDKIVRHLVKCVNNTKFIENKQGGAGAGIYLAFYTANQFVINIEPGKRLEAICILEKNKRYKLYQQRVTSFGYFVGTYARRPKKMGGAA